ncbi:KH domain-containing protein, partial [Salmonella enterica]|uniref:KH domain-containing protein n=1 Tax=Salmonella enterica TaxID=28901 RepID=UPI003D2BB8A8
PIGFRLGVTRTWDSRWYSKKDYQQLLHEDLKIRKILKQKLYQAGISKIEIERAANKVKVNIYSARPGLIIGKKGSGVDQLRAEVAGLT